MPRLDRDGVHIYYETHGSGPAVLLTHGFSATTAAWQPQVDALSQRYRLMSWDLRGHGQSDSPDDPAVYSEALSVADMLALLDAQNIDQAVLGGHSLGGYLSLAFHSAHPERVKGLMLLGTGPGFRKDPPREAWNQRARSFADTFEQKGLDALGRSPEVRAGSHRSAQGLAHAARGILTQHDARIMNGLGSIDVPALVMIGDRDKPFLAATDYMAAKIPRAKKVILSDAGHAANIEQATAFNTEFGAFLDQLWTD